MANACWSVGSPRFAAEAGVLGDAARQAAGRLEQAGKAVVAVFTETRLQGLIALREMGIRALMLAGDNPVTGAAIGKRLGLESRAALPPEDKAAIVAAMTRDDQVMMVGDGINDAPALARAGLGIAMGSGTHVALETADRALLRDRVMDVAAQIRLARATMANIRQNVAIALGLKGVVLVTTRLGLTGLWVAVLADTGATVTVTLDALWLLGFRVERRPVSRTGG
ncbi:hypothetical protein U879_00045 [Defluviimonas sp. 20V17]|uniref:P-type Zn(2+) transporter n=1 Tax=Allgaiera indica TaxID=765699 RepID=A0AAN4ZY42_9RHOB|nr:HAD-IC family P-type ATPase [Allgaiera indica]KDB05723.1 hypothetical protein U879_00045 [Defluviimonas sp. 20V17]GHD98496.1 hypothetical protein GCM10008024_02240 [Allgaiera indica]SDW12470.1 Cd2+/Zn2+-exporting ATPase [Allgaiera indica]